MYDVDLLEDNLHVHLATTTLSWQFFPFLKTLKSCLVVLPLDIAISIKCLHCILLYKKIAILNGTRATARGGHSQFFFIIKYAFDLDSQSHIKVKSYLEKSKCWFCQNCYFVLIKFVHYKVITNLAEYNNLTLNYKVIYKPRSNTVCVFKRTSSNGYYVHV